MAEVFTFNMDGFYELVEEFKNIEDEMPDALEKTTDKVVKQFRRNVKKRTPIRTGHLAKSYKVGGEGLGLNYEGVFYAERKKNKGYHFHLVEAGHRVVPRKGGIKKRKTSWSGKRYVEGRHMLEETAEKYGEIYPKEIAKTLEKVLKKNVK